MTLKKSNKFGAKKIVTSEGKFDSEREYARWCELKLLQRAGYITELRRQVHFVVIQEQREHGDQGKLLERRTEYIADFVYRENGKTIVEDVKGYKKGAAYELFVMKRKLMLKEFHIQVKEI